MMIEGAGDAPSVARAARIINPDQESLRIERRDSIEIGIGPDGYDRNIQGGSDMAQC